MQPVSKTPAIHINNLTVSYNRTPALTDVCFDVADGEFLGIIGPNGGGKSTLLKAILGLIPVEMGTVQIYGEDVKSRQTTIGYVPQFAALDRRFPITVLEVVLTGH